MDLHSPWLLVKKLHTHLLFWGYAHPLLMQLPATQYPITSVYSEIKFQAMVFQVIHSKPPLYPVQIHCRINHSYNGEVMYVVIGQEKEVATWTFTKKAEQSRWRKSWLYKGWSTGKTGSFTRNQQLNMTRDCIFRHPWLHPSLTQLIASLHTQHTRKKQFRNISPCAATSILAEYECLRHKREGTSTNLPGSQPSVPHSCQHS